MHRALNVAELVDLILAHLTIPDRIVDIEIPCNKSLAALARTCKSLQDSALNVLWREQYTLDNLLRCLPSHLCEVGKIRKLSGLHHVFVCDASVFDKISTELPCDFLCPNATRLRFRASQLSVIPLARFFLGPKIVDVDLHLTIGCDETLLDLPIQYPTLQYLSLTSFHLTCATSSKIVSSLRQITHLSIDSLDKAAFEHLSRLDTLKSLCLIYPCFEDTGLSCGPLLFPPTSPAFPALQKLYLDDVTPEFAIEVISVLSHRQLQSLHIGTDPFLSKTAAHRLYSALANHLSHTSLLNLRIGTPSDYTDSHSFKASVAEYMVDGPTLAVLFPFQNLTELRLQAPLGFLIDNSTAWDMARAWPHLRRLHLAAKAGAPCHNPHGIMSLHALTAFARYCPELTSLTLTTFDARTLLIADSMHTVSQSSLEFLDVGTSPLRDSLAVALFLHAVFPKLDRITIFDEWMWDEADLVDGFGVNEQCRVWKYVQGFLTSLTHN
ncbi:hypothetical protein R3P38DRAFT_2908703 [Favolaschia claudopus]|uniref:F-box domain-containing protein n=1 Tax=Favolaschia claudopus TaxID=2862362 RepID=A0AAW0CAB6_9AGAR